MREKIFHLINKATIDNKLTNYDFRIFMVLITYNSKNKICPSLKTIGAKMNIKSESFISKSLKKLQFLGYITIQRRKHQSNIYTLKTDLPDVQEPEKQKPEKQKPEKKEGLIDPVKIINDSMILICAEAVAKLNGRTDTEGSDFSFVKSMLKLKDDQYKNDGADSIRKCLLLIHILYTHKEKFNGNYYGYFKTVYSNSSYLDFKNKCIDGANNTSKNWIKNSDLWDGNPETEELKPHPDSMIDPVYPFGKPNPKIK